MQAIISSYLNLFHDKIITPFTGNRFRLISVMSLVVLYFFPSGGLNIDLCPFHLLSGIICPVCGLTRSITDMLHLDFLNAFYWHPLGLFVLAFLIVTSITGDPSRFYKYVIPSQLHSKRMFIAGGLFLSVWIIRISIGINF